jgi:hypothetical protein
MKIDTSGLTYLDRLVFAAAVARLVSGCYCCYATPWYYAWLSYCHCSLSFLLLVIYLQTEDTG